VTSDIAAQQSNFGNLPSYEDVKDDIAICTVPNINIGKFTIEQVKTWIDAVSLHGSQQKISKHKPTIAQIYIDFSYYGNILYQNILQEYEKEKNKVVISTTTTNHHHIPSKDAMEVTSSSAAASSSSTSVLHKRKFAEADSLFGKTTISNRMQSFKNNQQEIDNYPGKLLLKIMPKDIIRQRLVPQPSPTGSAGTIHQPQLSLSQSLPSSQTSTASSSFTNLPNLPLIAFDENDVKIVNDYFRQAIQRRSSYDKLMMDKQHQKMLETKRLRIEESNAIPLRRKLIEQKQQNQHHQQQQHYSNGSHMAMEQNDPEITFVDELDLDELVGGTISSVKSSSMATQQKKPVPPPSATAAKAVVAAKSILASTIGKAPPSAKNIVVKTEPQSSSSTNGPNYSSPNAPANVKSLAVKVSPSNIKVEPPAAASSSQPMMVQQVKNEPGVVVPPVKMEISQSSSQSDSIPSSSAATAELEVPHMNTANKPGMKPRRKFVIS
jgi:hypothetical protein